MTTTHLNMILRKHLTEIYADAQDIDLFWTPLKHSAPRNRAEWLRLAVAVDAAGKTEMETLPMVAVRAMA